MKYQRSSNLFIEAQQYIPGGVNSPVRAFKSVGGTPIFMKSAKGAYLTDVDNNQYIDYINSWGPMILGHLHPQVVQAVQDQTTKGFSYGTPTQLETKIAELIISMVPNIDKIRMVNSGTEACMSAIRLARAFTKKSKIIKFEGCYHGHSDSFLIQAGSGAITTGNPSSPGVTKGTAKDTILCKYNDLNKIKSIFKKHSDDIAAIIIEPVAGNMGCILPKNNFLEELRSLCSEHNSLLIFDEVMTGFRLAKGGAQELFKVPADLVCFGKIIGGGMPVGAFAGRNEIMDILAPDGPVYQAGTLSGNPIAMAAGYETLKILNENQNIYSKINKTTETLNKEISIILKNKNIDFQINSIGSMLSVFFSSKPINNFDDAKKADHQIFNKLFHFALKNAVYLPPSGYETWFISNEINEIEIEKTLDVFNKFDTSLEIKN